MCMIAHSLPVGSCRKIYGGGNRGHRHQFPGHAPWISSTGPFLVPFRRNAYQEPGQPCVRSQGLGYTNRHSLSKIWMHRRMSWTSFFLATTPIIVATLVAWLQHRNWRKQNLDEIRNATLSDARELVSQIATVFDKRLYRQRRSLWSVRSKSPPEIANCRNDYIEALKDWNDNYSSIKGRLMFLYGTRRVYSFERKFHDVLRQAGSVIEKYDRSLSSGKKVNERNLARELRAIEVRLDVLGFKAYELYSEMLNLAADEETRPLQELRSLSTTNYNNLTIHYLLMRLFGLTKK